MHKYMRAIGFSTYIDRKKLKELLIDVIVNSDERAYTVNQDDIMMGEFCKYFTENMGIAVCGEFDDEDKFIYDYYYPFLRGNGIATTEDVSIESHAARQSYAGVCDDIKMGISIIFYLQNMIPYVKAQALGQLPIKGTSLTLSALSISGVIVMPIMKDEKQIKKGKRETANRNKLIAAARKGDEDAIETLTLDDMNMYTAISRRIQKEDVFSLVDTYFMPYGVECDHYSVLGEIADVQLTTNKISEEQIYMIKIICNEVSFDVCINASDLYGEPQVGRRFKGIVWLQGYINYPSKK